MLDNWQTLARRWGQTHQCLLVDLPNHGRSPHADRHDYEHMAEAVIDLAEHLGFEHFSVLGHSMGGKVAMQIALSHPERVQRLIVVDMSPRQYRRGHDDIFAALKALDPASLTDRKEAAARLAEHITDPGVQLFLLKNLGRRAGGGFEWRMNLPVIDRDYDQLTAPVGNFGDRYEGPALFLRGAKSGYVRDEDIPYIEALFPQAEAVTIAGAGHWVHAEAPEATYEAVRDFLAGATGS